VGATQKKGFLVAIQMTTKTTQTHCAKDVPPTPSQKEAKDIYVHLAKGTTAKIHVMIFSW